MKKSVILLIVILPFVFIQGQELLELDSGIKLSNSISNNPEPGTIRWSGSDFQGYNGNYWASLTNTNNSANVNVINYFLGLPNGLQTLLNAGESIQNLLAAGADPNDFLGLEYLDGYIFQISNDGSGMMTTKNDYHIQYEWGCLGIGPVGGARGTAIGTGRTNTDDIINNCYNITGIINAAVVADRWDAHDLQDWFLPSVDEFELMFSVLGEGDNIGNFDSGFYWTSTQFEFGGSDAYLYFTVDSQADGIRLLDKSTLGFVRPIRTF